MQQAFGDHGHHQIARARALRADQLLQPQLVDRAEDGLDVAVRKAAFDGEAFLGRNKAFPGERAADDVDECVGQVGNVAERFVLDLFPDTVGAAEQVGAIDLAFVVARCGGHMNPASSGRHTQL